MIFIPPRMKFLTKPVKSFLPESLRKLLEVLIKGRLKRSSVGRVIVSAARLRSAVFSITFGLGVETDNMSGSRWLIDKLSKLDFSVSYDEIKHHKQSVVLNDDSLSAFATREPDFVQWVADKVDYNISTLDGKNTFHGMVIIAASIGNSCQFRTRIRRENGNQRVKLRQAKQSQLKNIYMIG